MDRRRFIGTTALLPLAAALAGCGRKGHWPEGMQEIKWDRDTCARCGMVISDRRFAAQLVGRPPAGVFKFDDIGCAIFFERDKLKDHAWLGDPATRLWVADLANQGEQLAWLDATAAHYVGKPSPMGYNYAAVPRPQAMAIDFATLRGHVLAKGK